MNIVPMIGIVIAVNGYIWLCILPLMGQSVGVIFRYEVRL
jgi:hypothetical protein